MKKITPQTESKLMGVLEKVAELTATGTDPNEAIIKAGQGRLRPGEIELVVRAYNIGRTNCRREDADSLLEKTATFPMADSDTVSAAMFPANVKTAAQVVTTTVVSSDYAIPARTIARQLQAVKTAAHVWETPKGIEKQAREKLDTKSPVRKLGDAQRAQRLYEVKRAAHRQAVQDLADVVDELGNYFRTAACQPQAAVKKAATALHGEAVADAVFSAMYTAQPGLQRISSAKTAACRVPASDRSLTLVQSVIAKAANCRGTHAAMAAAEEDLPKKPQPAAPPQEFDSILTDSAKQAALLPSMGEIGSKLQGGLQSMKSYGDNRTDPEPAVSKALYQLTDPDHEEQLRQLQAQTSFQELLARDKVLQGYKPQQVADAFGQITQSAPNLATQPLAMQALLRKQLEQGHMDTFDVNDMIGMSNNLQDRFSGMNSSPAV